MYAKPRAHDLDFLSESVCTWLLFCMYVFFYLTLGINGCFGNVFLENS